MTERPKALIIGAGIGGLAAGISLEQAGFQVVLFERADSLRESGFGLLLAANAVRALRLLGVADGVIERSEVGRDGELRAADGSVLKRISMDGIRRATGEDAVCALRRVVHAALVDGLSHAEVRTGARVVGFEQSASGVDVELVGGERVHGQLLVAADGLHSIVRAKLHGDVVRPSGLVAYRGLCRDTAWNITGSQYFGRGMEAGIARASRDSVYWYLSVKQAAAHSELEPKAAAVAIGRSFDDALRSLIERTEPSEVHRDELFDRKPLGSWGDRRITLVGDAAHPMLPHAGQGAAQALEDAVVLGRCLATASDLQAGLRRYEALRIPRTSKVVAVARRNAQVSRIENAWVCELRDWVLAHGPASLMEKQLVSLAQVDLEV